MNIGIPKERRPFEFRVGMTPAGVEALTKLGHPCYVEHEAGLGAGFSDMDYERGGARIVYSPEEAFGRADLVLKVARPLYEELQWLSGDAAIAGLLRLIILHRSPPPLRVVSRPFPPKGCPCLLNHSVINALQFGRRDTHQSGSTAPVQAWSRLEA